MLWGDQYGLSPSENVAFEDNFVYYNSTSAPDELSHGLRILPGIDASTITVRGNSFDDLGGQGGAFAVVNQGTGVPDASGNWWDTTNEATILGLMNGAVDFTPYLDSGTDVGSDPTDGFQGDFSTLHVTTLGSQSGGLERIQEGIDLVTASEVIVEAGTYNETPTVNKVNVLLRGATGTPSDVVIDPDGAGDGITVTATGVKLQDLQVIDAQNGVAAIGADGLVIENVELLFNATAGFDVSTATSLTLTDLVLTGNATDSDIDTVTTVTLNTSTGSDQDTVDVNTPAIGGDTHFRHTRGASVQDIVGYTGVTDLFVNLGDGQDTVNAEPDPNGGATIHVDGGNPTSIPGDTLNADLTGVTNPAHNITGPRAGNFTSDDHETIFYSDIETVAATGAPFPITINIGTFPGGADGLANFIIVRLDATGTVLEVLLDPDGPGAAPPVLAFAGLLADVASLEILGSTDDDTLRIEDPNGMGLPSFTGTPTGAHDNAAYNGVTGKTLADVGLHFDGGPDGGPDVNTLQLDLPAANVAYFSDTVDSGNSGVIDVDAAAMGGLGVFSTSFEDLAPISIFVAGPGSLLIDASGTPTSLAIDDDAFYPGGPLPPLAIPPAPGNGVSVVYDSDLPATPGFETVQFTGFADVTVRSGIGAQTIDLIALDNVGGALTDIILDGDDFIDSDAFNDTLRVQTLPAGVTATLMSGLDGGGPTGDLYDIDNLIARPRISEVIGPAAIGSLDEVRGPIVVNPALGSPSPVFPATEEAGVETLRVNDVADANGDTVIVTSTTIDGITSEPAGAPANITYRPGPGAPPAEVVETVNIITSGTSGDIVHVESTAAGAVYNVDTGGGDTINVFSNASTVAFPGDATSILDNINGQLNLETGLGVDTLNVSDFGDDDGDTYRLTVAGTTTELTFGNGAAAVDIIYDATGGGGNLENFNLVGSRTDGTPITTNTYNINDTTATTATVISDGQAGLSFDSEFNIQADAVQPGSSNTFNGFDGNDEFNVDFATDLAISVTSSFTINGGVPAADSDNRDVVNIDTSLDTGGFSRTLGITFATAGSGDVDITGLGTSGVLDINEVETLDYEGGGRRPAQRADAGRGERVQRQVDATGCFGHLGQPLQCRLQFDRVRPVHPRQRHRQPHRRPVGRHRGHRQRRRPRGRQRHADRQRGGWCGRRADRGADRPGCGHGPDVFGRGCGCGLHRRGGPDARRPVGRRWRRTRTV